MSNFRTFGFASFFPLLIRIFECIRIWRNYMIIKVQAPEWPILKQNPSTFGWDMTQNVISPSVRSVDMRWDYILGHISVKCSLILLQYDSSWVINRFFVTLSDRLKILNESGIAKTVTVADCYSNRCHCNRLRLYSVVHGDNNSAGIITPLDQMYGTRGGRQAPAAATA